MIREAEGCIWSFLTELRVTQLYEFQLLPMATLANNIMDSLDAQSLSVLTPEMIRIGRHFHCMMELLPTEEVIPPYGEVPKCELYLERHAGKAFVSLDLRRADYTLLLLACREWVAGQPSWESFVTRIIQENKKRGGNASIPCIEKLRMVRTRVLGKLCHTKNVALQSFVLCLAVRALIKTLVEDHTKSLPVERIFRFSCDELILVCRNPTDAPAVLAFVNDALCSMLPKLIPFSRIEAFILHKFDMTPSMQRLALVTSDMIDLELDMNPKNRCQEVKEGVIDEPWTGEHETEVEEKNPNIFFVRESVGGTKQYAIKTIPRALLTEAMPFVVDYFGLCKPPPVVEETKETDEPKQQPNKGQQQKQPNKKGKQDKKTNQPQSKGGKEGKAAQDETPEPTTKKQRKRPRRADQRKQQQQKQQTASQGSGIPTTQASPSVVDPLPTQPQATSGGTEGKPQPATPPKKKLVIRRKPLDAADAE